MFFKSVVPQTIITIIIIPVAVNNNITGNTKTESRAVIILIHSAEPTKVDFVLDCFDKIIGGEIYYGK